MGRIAIVSVMFLAGACVLPGQKADHGVAPVDQPAAVREESAADALRRAAEKGDAKAQKDLGTQYIKGEGVPQDYTEAAQWIRRSAEQGYADAQNNLGVLYAQGKGVPHDHVFAYMWMSLAAAQGNHDAAQNRDNISRLMTKDRLAEAKELVKSWRPTAQPGETQKK